MHKNVGRGPKNEARWHTQLPVLFGLESGWCDRHLGLLFVNNDLGLFGQDVTNGALIWFAHSFATGIDDG